MISKLIIGGVAVVAVASGAGVAAASVGDARSPQAGGATTSAASGLVPDTVNVLRCDGGAQKHVYNRSVNQYSTFGEGASFTVPGAMVGLWGPAVGTDTLSVTFSAETQLRGSAAGDDYDWIGLEVLLDGVPMQPAGPPDSVMAISGSKQYAMNAAQFCGKVRQGPHRITVRSNLVDNGTNDTLTAWLDDYLLRVEVSQ